MVMMVAKQTDGLRRNGLAQVVHDEMGELLRVDGIIPVELRGEGGVGLVEAVATSLDVSEGRPTDAHRMGNILRRRRRWQRE